MDDTTQPNATQLTPQQERAAEMIASGTRMGDVAAALDVDRTTVWRWTRLPEFERLTNELRRSAWRAAADRMRTNACLAAETLAGVLQDHAAPARDRVAAARAVMAATGPIFSPLVRGDVPDLETRGVPPTEHDWRAVVIGAAQRAGRMAGHLYIDTRTAGAAWADAGLAEAFPGMFDRLRALADDPDRLRAACDDVLAKWEAALDTAAIERPDEP